MIINPAYNSTEPSIGLKMNMDRTTMKCYMADTGLLISHAFDERSMVSEEIYQKLLCGTLEFNEGMIIENIVAQMLRVAGQQLYFYTSSGANMRADRMEVDFLVAKSSLQRRHNISPIEVKSVGQYQTRSLDKFNSRYGQFLNTSYVLHAKDVEKRPDRICLPLYMAGLLNT
jgi:predicted AAA+ superfamily ATPase